MKTIKTLQDWLDEAEETKFFIVLDEKTLNTMKGKKNKTAKFSTKEEANWAAAGKLNYWNVIEVNKANTEWYDRNDGWRKDLQQKLGLRK